MTVQVNKVTNHTQPQGPETPAVEPETVVSESSEPQVPVTAPAQTVSEPQVAAAAPVQTPSEPQKTVKKSGNRAALMLFLLAPISSEEGLEKKGSTTELIKAYISVGLRLAALLLAFFGLIKGCKGVIDVVKSMFNNEPWLNIVGGLEQVIYALAFWGVSGLMNISGHNIKEEESHHGMFGIYAAIFSVICAAALYIISQ